MREEERSVMNGRQLGIMLYIWKIISNFQVTFNEINKTIDALFFIFHK